MLEVDKGNSPPATDGADKLKSESTEEEVDEEYGILDDRKEDPRTTNESEPAKPTSSRSQSKKKKKQRMKKDNETGDAKSEKNTKKKSDKKPKSSKSLTKEKKRKKEKDEKDENQNETETKEENKEETTTEREKDENQNETEAKQKDANKKSDKKPKSTKSLTKEKKRKKEKKVKEKDENETEKTKEENKEEKTNKNKKKRGSKKKLVDDNETGRGKNLEKRKGDKENVVSPVGEKDKVKDDSSEAHCNDSVMSDDSAMNRFTMTSLRKMEKARAKQQAPMNFDSDDDGLWVGTAVEKQKKKRKRPGKKRRDSTIDQKAEWESSVDKDDSFHPYDSDADDSLSDMEYRDQSNRSMMSSSSDTDYQDQSNRSMTSSGSARSFRSSSGRSYRSSRRSSSRSLGRASSRSIGSGTNTSFRSLKYDRTVSLQRSMIGEANESSVTSEKSEEKPLSQIDLRNDLEAQAEARVKNRCVEGGVISAFKKDLSAVFEVSDSLLDMSTEYTDKRANMEDGSMKSHAASEGTDKIPSMDVSSGSKAESGEKRTLKEKWLSLKKKARTGKGYIVIVSIALSVVVILTIVFVTLLAV